MKNTIQEIIGRVAVYYGLKPAEITQRRRFEPVATVRSVTMLLLHEAGVDSYAAATALGLTCKNTVWTQRHSIVDRMEGDAVLRADVANLRRGAGAGGETFVSVYIVRRVAWRNRRLAQHKAGRPCGRGRFLPRLVSGVRGLVSQRSLGDAAAGGWHGPDIFERDAGLPGFGSLLHLKKLIGGI
jgi:hypothetical protein